MFAQVLQEQPATPRDEEQFAPLPPLDLGSLDALQKELDDKEDITPGQYDTGQPCHVFAAAEHGRPPFFKGGAIHHKCICETHM